MIWAISPAQYLRICQYRRKNKRNFTILSEIPLSVHIAERANIVELTWAFEFLITYFFDCVINHVIFQELILKSTF
jgi:hypothetical protein